MDTSPQVADVRPHLERYVACAEAVLGSQLMSDVLNTVLLCALVDEVSGVVLLAEALGVFSEDGTEAVEVGSWGGRGWADSSIRP